MSMFPVVIIGGCHDGLEGTVTEECIEAGFLVESATHGDGQEWWYGYRCSGERDRPGLVRISPA